MANEKVTSAVQSLLTPNFSEFEKLVFTLLSRENDNRKFAEEVLEELQKYPDVCIQYLIKTLRESAIKENRSFSGVMLRKLLVSHTSSLWNKLSPEVKETLKKELIIAIQQEPEEEIGRKICDTVSEIASVLLLDEGWDEFIPLLFQFLGSEDEPLIERGLLILDYIIYKDQLVHFNGKLLELFRALDSRVQHKNMKIKKAASVAICCVLQYLESKEEESVFGPLFPKVLNCLGIFLNLKDYTATEDILESFIDIADNSPKIIKNYLNDIALSMIQIAQTSEVEEGSRILAIEFLTRLCEKKEKGLSRTMKKIPNFVAKLVEILMEFMLNVEDDEDWHKADDADEMDVGHEDMYDVGQESFDRLALAFNGEVLLPIVGPILKTWISDSDWKKRHATLICLSQIAEGCYKVMKNELMTIANICVLGLSDDHAKVRWAACQATGQLCTDLGPDLQTDYHTSLIPALIKVMEDSENPRVQAHASSAIVNFTELCEKEEISPYVEQLMSCFFKQMMSDRKVVIEAALTALSSVAECVKDQFEVYYGSVMPLLRQIFVQASDKKYNVLRAKALECISLVGMSVGIDMFRNDAKDIMQMLNQLQNSSLAADDPIHNYMLQAGGRICKCLGKEFLPYLDIVMPHVLKKASQEPDVRITSLDDDSDDDPDYNPEIESDSDEDIDRIVLGDKVLKIRSSAMEEKTTACNMLVCYADELKEGFLPYVQDVSNIIVPLLKFYYNEEVREAAYEILPVLLDSAILAASKNAGADINFVRQMLDYIWTNLIDAMSNEINLELLAASLNSIGRIVELVNSELLTPSMVENCFNHMKVIAKESEERRSIRIEDQELDDDFEELDDDEKDELKLIQGLSNVIESYLTVFGDELLPLLNQIMPFILKLIDKELHPEILNAGYSLLDDIIKRSPAAVDKYLGDFFFRMLEDATHKDAGVRQDCLFGIGLLCSKYPEKIENHTPAILKQLLEVIQRSDARDEGSEEATDNAVSALGKFMISFPMAVDAHIVKMAFLQNLPLKDDDMEAKLMHNQLVNMIQNNDPKVLGEGNQNLPRIIQILVQILGNGDSLAEPETIKQIIELLKNLQGSIGPDILSAAISELTPKQQTAFHKITSES